MRLSAAIPPLLRPDPDSDSILPNLPCLVTCKVAGILLNKELTALGKIMSKPEHPVVACIGGSKVRRDRVRPRVTLREDPWGECWTGPGCWSDTSIAGLTTWAEASKE